jgi:hypothetical protein
MIAAYSDEFPSCEETRVTLQLYCGDLHPSIANDTLKINPTRITVQGRVGANSRGKPHTEKLNAWFLSSEHIVKSLDARRHLDWLLEQLEPSSKGLAHLQSMPGVEMWVGCTWWSAYGHGGPILSPAQMKRLADLNLTLGFDIYFFAPEETKVGTASGESESATLQAP